MKSNMESLVEKSAINVTANQRFYARFLDLCYNYAELGGKAGVDIIPYRLNSDRRFLKMPEPIQMAILSNLETTTSIFASAIENGVNIDKGNLASVWWGINRLGLRPNSGLFSKLSNGDVIEIYNVDNIQIFRTFNLFECLSYSIEELFTYEWWELFRRDTAVTSKIQEVAAGILNGHIKEPYQFEPKNHIVTEIFSPNRNRAEACLKLMAPLRDNRGQPAGYLSSMRIIELFKDSASERPE